MISPANLAERTQPLPAAPLAAAAGVAVALLLAAVAALAALAGIAGSAAPGLGAGGGAVSQADGVSAFARRDIPPAYLRLYERAAAAWGIDWAVLAGIGRVECDHGRDPDPSCSREGAVNSAGAGGPMQFLASTWAVYGTDGDGDGRADRWDPADAIFSAARYLRAAGAPAGTEGAIFAYNHAGWYVAEVERWAARYRAGEGGALSSEGASAGGEAAEGRREAAGAPAEAAGAPGEAGSMLPIRASSLASQTGTPVRFVGGAATRLMPEDGHVALLPALAPPVVQAMIVAGNELQSLAYGPGGHPDPRGSPEEDCSSSVNYVLYRSGIRPLAEILRDNPLAESYETWGAPGPGRWVSIYATGSHVFMTIAGLRLDTSHNGTDTGPNRAEDGPRWRIFDRIPEWARWSVRHPPGL